MEEAPRLWMIVQSQKLSGYPYWVKDAMKELGLYKQGDISIQINSPKMNEMLWTVKALVKIQPIRFPDGMPTDDDVGYTNLKPNGEFVITKKLTTTTDDIPLPANEDYKIVDGFRMCRNCKHKVCLNLGMCQKLYHQSSRNYLEKIGPQLYNFVDHPDKLKKKEVE